MQTNPNYLSKIINHYHQKNFRAYLREIRINYVISELKNNKKFRLYSIKGIAEEIGFKGAESFSKAFHEKTGLYPSYFIKKLNTIGLDSRNKT